MQAAGKPKREVVGLWRRVSGSIDDALPEGAACADAIGQLAQKPGREICTKGGTIISLAFEMAFHLNLSRSFCKGEGAEARSAGAAAGCGGFCAAALVVFEERGGAVCKATAFMNFSPSPAAKCLAPLPIPVSMADSQF